MDEYKSKRNMCSIIGSWCPEFNLHVCDDCRLKNLLEEYKKRSKNVDDYIKQILEDTMKNPIKKSEEE